MTRPQIMTLVSALIGLGLGLVVANMEFNDIYLVRGAELLYGALGMMLGYVVGGRLFLDHPAMSEAKS